MNNRAFLPYPRLIATLSLAAALVACGETKEPAETPKPAPSAIDTPASTSDPMVAPQPGEPVSIEDEIHAEYAAAAVSIPRRVSDSIIQANKADPQRIEKELTRYLKRQDSAARATIASQRGISIDSLNEILKKKEAEREER